MRRKVCCPRRNRFAPMAKPRDNITARKLSSSMRLAVPLLHAGLVFLVVPALALPFSTPKLALLTLGALLLFALAPPRKPHPAALVWLGLAALHALQGSPRAVLLDASAALLFASV